MGASSLQDLYDQGRARLLVTRPDLQALPGDVTDMEIQAGAAMGDLVIGNAAQQARDLFISTAAGDALAAVVRDRTGLERLPAVSAIGTQRFTRATSVSSGSIPIGTRIATTPDSTGAFQEYTTDSAVAVGVGVLTVTVGATAVTPGRAGNATLPAQPTINRVLDALFDTFTTGNATVFAGGAEEETDEELRERARGFSRTLRRGTIAAVEYGAKTVPQVRVATAVEESNTGLVTLYVSDAEGNSNAGMVTLVEAEILNWRAAGANVETVGGTLLPITISLALTVRSGVSIPALVAKVVAAVVAAVNRLGIGETVYRSLISDAARAVDRDNIVEVTVITPAASIVPSANQVPRTTTALVGVA